MTHGPLFNQRTGCVQQVRIPDGAVPGEGAQPRARHARLRTATCGLGRVIPLGHAPWVAVGGVRAWRLTSSRLGLALVLAFYGCGDPATLEVDGGGLPDHQAAPVDAGAAVPEPIVLSVVRVEPSRGSYLGGQRAVIRGSGFRSSAVAVRFGTREVRPLDVRRIDSGRLEVRVPPGGPGRVDVTVEQDGESATLTAGYAYDSVAVRPTSGPPTGGTPLTLRAARDLFDERTTVALDGLECTDMERTSATELICRTPAHAPGLVDVQIAASGESLTLEDAYEYVEPFGRSPGVGGGPIEGRLEG